MTDPEDMFDRAAWSRFLADHCPSPRVAAMLIAYADDCEARASELAARRHERPLLH